jgi:RNA polymerase sigma factor (sigma-70 family)
MLMQELDIRPQRATASVDLRLVQRCIDGNQEAWTQLVKRYERLVYSIALRICHETEAAADVMQQVFLQLYQQLEEIRNLPSLPAWISTVTRRRAYDHLRSIRPTEPLLEDSHADEADVFSRIQHRHALEIAMAALPVRNRRLIEMLYMSPEAHTYEQVAERLGMPVSSVGPTRIRTLKKLRTLLG